ncbi:hypothetical protein NS277_11805 [Novosphingobium barchaimii]|nr:hypothetical protein NS277_11805 [Novosphingobium barchaimii]
MGLGVLPWLGACGRGDRGALVMGDQVHLVESRMKAAGQLDDLPYRITWANFPGAAPLLEALNAGAVDTAPAGDLPVILAAAAGCRLQIAAVTRMSDKAMAIVVPRRSNIQSVADLAGKSVIISSARGSISHYLLLEALNEARIPISSVRIGFMLPNEAASAFATGQIDAWATFGTYQVRAEADGARILRDGSGIGPGYSTIVVSEAALADPAKRTAIGDYLERLRRASLWSQQQPDAYAKLYSKQTGMDLAVTKAWVARERPAFTVPDATFVAALQRASDRFYRPYGVLPRKVNVAALIAPGMIGA